MFDSFHLKHTPTPPMIGYLDKNNVQISQIFWPFSWFVLNICLTIVNKAVFQFHHFNFPLTLSLVHMLCTYTGTFYVLHNFPSFQKVAISQKGRNALIKFSLLFIANIVIGNIGLKYVPVSLVQVVRSMIPAITMGLSYIILGKKYSQNLILAVFPICFGVVLASVTEVNFDIFGFSMIVIVCFLSSTKSVVTKAFLSEVLEVKLSPIQLLYELTPWASIWLLPFIILTGEASQLREWIHTSDSIVQPLSWVFFSGSLAFLLNICNFIATKITSPLTITILGNIKHVCTILFSILIFKNQVTTLNAIGIVITVAGAALYSHLNFQEKVKSTAPLLESNSK